MFYRFFIAAREDLIEISCRIKNKFSYFTRRNILKNKRNVCHFSTECFHLGKQWPPKKKNDKVKNP